MNHKTQTIILLLSIGILAACATVTTPPVEIPPGQPGDITFDALATPPAVFRLSITAVLRGAAAEDQLGPDPSGSRQGRKPADYEWLLIRMTGECLQGDPNGVYLDTLKLRPFATGRRTDSQALDLQRPRLAGTYLPGAAVDGWVLLSIPSDSTDIKLQAGELHPQWYRLNP